MLCKCKDQHKINISLKPILNSYNYSIKLKCNRADARILISKHEITETAVNNPIPNEFFRFAHNPYDVSRRGCRVETLGNPL
jgi:hypothetical protein